MTKAPMLRPAHLVGSIPCASADAVMRLAAGKLGSLLRRLPDGETGDRADWIQYLIHVVAKHPFMERVVDTSGGLGRARHYHRPKPGVDPSSIEFPPLGYAANARESWQTFRALREQGIIPPETRFLVAIPTPTAFMMIYIDPAHRLALEPAFFRRMRAEIDELTATIPADDLAIQWDAVFEFLVMEGARTVFPGETAASMVERMRAAANLVPGRVETGFHFCYGDFQHRHSVEPRDMEIMVTTWNDLRRAPGRRIDYVHMPVPRGRDDSAYFAPLRDLKLDGEEVYLGLVHFTDGIDGGRKRIAAASRFLPEFGIATECGFGRRPPETIAQLLDLHLELARI